MVGIKIKVKKKLNRVAPIPMPEVPYSNWQVGGLGPSLALEQKQEQELHYKA